MSDTLQPSWTPNLEDVPFTVIDVPLDLTAGASSRMAGTSSRGNYDRYYYTPVEAHLTGTGPDDRFYSYKDSAWITRSALPAGAVLVHVSHCHEPTGSTVHTGEAACVRNVELLRAQATVEDEAAQGGGGASSEELEALKAQVATLQNTLTQVQSTANTAKSTADAAKTAAATAQNSANTAQNTANTANTNATNAQNTANTAKTTATNAQNAVNTINTSLANMPTHYVGTAAPSNSLGKNGDVYLQPI